MSQLASRMLKGQQQTKKKSKKDIAACFNISGSKEMAQTTNWGSCATASCFATVVAPSPRRTSRQLARN
jgi:hypothetical protein